MAHPGDAGLVKKFYFTIRPVVGQLLSYQLDKPHDDTKADLHPG